MRILIARWSPARATAKRALMTACEETQVVARPNWANPSVGEMREAIEPVAKATGVRFTGALDTAQPMGTRADYQSEVRWGVYHPSAGTGVIQYDTRTGRVKAPLPALAFRKFRDALPLAIEHANAGAQINRVDARKEVAVALMATFPFAPFCILPSIGPGLWMLAIDSMEFNRARRFLSRVSTPALDLSELDGGRGAYHAVIEQSLSSVHERFGTRTGWRVIAQKSHRELAEQVDQIDNP